MAKASRCEPRAFRSEALVDFVDDALTNGRTLTKRDIEALMSELATLGITRVSWGYYGDGHGGFLNPTGYAEDRKGGWKHYDATYRKLGNPLRVAVEAGHRHGLEIYAYFKPYETGPGAMFPEGSPEARKWGRLDCVGGRLGWMDPFVQAHPELRIQRRTDDVPAGIENGAICRIRLIKKDASPTRVTREHLQIWVSDRNFRYTRAPVDFRVEDGVERAVRESRDHAGHMLTRRGDPVRVLTLSGLNLKARYILVTTDFTDGPADFVNSGLSMMEALDPRGRRIPGVFSAGGVCWFPHLVDFRNRGLMFDYGWGAAPATLDSSNASGKQGIIAFARGRNTHLPGALCETEPRVRKFWLSCLEEMIAAGVDGVDFREENHGTHTDYPAEYGFNPAVLAKCRRRGGVTLERIADVRGEAYTEFLRACRRRLARAGKRMRYNLQLDFFRPDPPPERLLAYPANIRFEWQRWIREGLVDEAILRFYSHPFEAVFEDRVSKRMLSLCARHHVPVCVNRYVKGAGERLPDEVRRIRRDGRFSGFIFYEVCDYIRFGRKAGSCSVTYPPVREALRTVVEQLKTGRDAVEPAFEVSRKPKRR